MYNTHQIILCFCCWHLLSVAVMERRLNMVLGRKGTLPNLDPIEKQTSSKGNSIDVVCARVIRCLSDTFITFANEPSLAFFRIQEHIRKSTPMLLQEQAKVNSLNDELRGCCYDLDSAITAVDTISKTIIHFNRINELLKSTLFTKLQLDYKPKQNLGFEMGLDVSSMDVLNFEPSTIETSPYDRALLTKAKSVKELPSVLLLSNNLSTNNSNLTRLSTSMSRAAVQVREKAISLTRRAFYTKSEEISYGGVSGSIILENVSPSANVRELVEQDQDEESEINEPKNVAAENLLYTH